jgi:hypothetical protein
MLSLRPWLFGCIFQLEVGFANLAHGVPGIIATAFGRATVICGAARVG